MADLQHDVRIALLGPLVVEVGGEVVHVPSGHQRTLLAVLALDVGRVVPTDRLVDLLWADQPPRSARNSLQSHIARLRSHLGGRAVIGREPPGYLLTVTSDSVDVVRFERLVDEATGDDDPGRRRALLGRALDLWRGNQPAALTAQGLDTDARRLVRRRLAAQVGRAEAALATGDQHAAESDVRAVLVADPLHEPAVVLLVRILAAAGLVAEADSTVTDFRRRLVDELGLDPSPTLDAVHTALLRGQIRPSSAPAPGTGPSSPSAREDDLDHREPAPILPRVRYARAGRTRIAHQVVGDGPVDLVWLPGWISNLELRWEEPRFAGFIRALAEHVRVILLDKRGTGLSDPVSIDDVPDLDTRADDVRAVLDHVGSERAVVLGFSEGGTMAVRFATTHPDRVAGLVLYGSWARATRSDGHDAGWTVEQSRRRLVLPLQRGDTVDPRWFAPSAADDPAFAEWFSRYVRQSAPPGVALALLAANAAMDVRAELPEVRAPTLVIHREDDMLVDRRQGEQLAAAIRGAQLAIVPGDDHWPWIGDSEPVLAAMTRFIRSVTD